MKSNEFINILAALPEQIEKAQDICSRVKVDLPEKINAVYIAGMGGSGVAGLLAKSILSENLKIPVELIRDYAAPFAMTKNSLLVAVSYSGNTEETLSVVAQAEKRRVPMVFISSGGKLAELAEAKKIDIFEIPKGYQPRAALGFLLIPLLYIFEKLKMAPGLKEDLAEAVIELKKLCGEIGPGVSPHQNEAHKLAAKICKTFPLIYSSAALYPAAYRFKCQLNENAKLLAHAGEMTESNHNEIEGLCALKRGAHNHSLLYLRSERDSERTKKQMEITKSLVGAQLGGVREIFPRGKSLLCQMLSLVYFLDMVSAYVAEVNGTDPAEIGTILKLKKELSR
ncbi:MAG: bifunctional phosphoglucose/phosphomannose isomerase [Candidatus Margulisiibacteriota bacterium]